MEKLRSRKWKKIPLKENILINIYAWIAPKKAHDMLKKYRHLEFEKKDEKQ